VESLPLKSGSLQGVVVVDYPFSHRFESLHIIYDGVNGQLPNLDLFNTATAVASGQMGIGVTIQQMWKHSDSYIDRLQVMLRGMLNQGIGHASGPHSSFIPYHVDAITLQAVGEGWQDEMALGRCVEGTFRSLNNLLEHFHQSFFFYLLMQANRFVSIGTYLPSAMLVAVNFTIMAIALWVQSGKPDLHAQDLDTTKKSKPEADDTSSRANGGSGAITPSPGTAVAERSLFLPLAFVIIVHFIGVIPLYIFNHSSEGVSLCLLFIPVTWLTTIIVNDNEILHLRLHQCLPPARHLSTIELLLRTYRTAIPPDQILFTTSSWDVSFGSLDIELLSRVFGRCALDTAHLCTAIPGETDCGNCDGSLVKRLWARSHSIC
jgi:glycosylphosphatidylinositol transamidase